MDKNKYNIKDVYTLICTLAVVTSSIIIVMTFLSTYHFINTILIFTSYYPLQLSISITMLLWSIKFYTNKVGKQKRIYSSICITISLISLLFMAII
ncbi:hypothetical protein [Clostridium sp.]|uniref:hypothetical protein n=1 Tax=Clostridium sp. TaxID=1506 RepID=UPI002615E86F|nr:hypothetical protein [Clostridium sp.]